MNTGCPVCGEVEHQPVLCTRGFSIVQCRGCTLQYAQPMPDRAQLAAYYQDPTYFAGDIDEGYADYDAMAKVLRPLAKRRLQTITAVLGRPGRILDFGCAAGYFLEQAQTAGWRIAGVELAHAMAELAAARLGISIHADLGPLTDQEGFDAVTLWEVIEHLPDPIDTLQHLRACLRPGGVLALSTPNTGHWQALEAPEAWTSYRPPAHLLYFTETTLRTTLERAGFSEIVIGRSGPMPRLPGWLERASLPLQRQVAKGSASSWRLALLTWRAIRLAGMIFQRARSQRRDIYMTLEASGRAK